MEAAASGTLGQAGQSRWVERGRDLGLLLLLVLLTVGLRGWLLTHTEVTARDSIGFIRYALQLENEPLTEVLRRNHQHPGYATLVMLTSWPTRQWTGTTDSLTMQWSAQLASSLASVLLVVPLFYLGKALFSHRVGFWATAVFQSLPVSGRVLADALSEALFLLWMAAALLAAVHALRTRHVALFGLTGFLGGLAYLTRPEGAFVLAATGLVLLGWQLSAHWQPWQQVLKCGAVLTVAAAAVGGPYVFVLGRFTPKPTAHEILTGERTVNGHSTPRESLLLAAAGPLPPGLVLLADRWVGLSSSRALQAVAKETQKGFNYVGWVPALLALYWFAGRFRTTPGMWVLLVLCLLHAAVLWCMAMTVRYVSERHVLILVLCGIFWTVAGLQELPHRWTALRERFPAFGRWLPTALLLAFVFAGLPKTLKPLHANRAGHHAAGVWLAEHADPADEVLDPFCWAHYYAGRVFTERTRPPAPAGHAPLTYVVLEPDDLDVRAEVVRRARQLAEQGQLVFHWPGHRGPEQAQVKVFAVPSGHR